MSVDGILIIDKPAGWTSHDVVAKLRGVFRQRRIGHGGTLDPMATGVLPIFTGKATKAAQFIENAEKEYIAGLRLGITTDTQDITGAVISTKNVSGKGADAVTADAVKAVLPRFTGKQKQIPPMYSAVKIDGKKLYELARQGAEIERAARDIEIFSMEITDPPRSVPCGKDGNMAQPDIYLRISCSKGTYIRTLCHDIGRYLGCGAAMSYLRRVRAGAYAIDDAHPLDEGIKLADYILSVDSVFGMYSSIALNEAETRKARNGALKTVSCPVDGIYRFYAPDGTFLLVGEVKNKTVMVIKNFFGD